MSETPKTKSGWRWLRRILIALAVLATLIAILYAEEDWRGKRAWENCKRELEAKGEDLDWNHYIPPPVPDDQNFFTVNTNFYLKFVKLQTEEQGNAVKRVQWLRLGYWTNAVDLAKAKPLVARLTVLSPDETVPASAKISLTIQLNSPTARSQIQDAIRAVAGRGINGAQGFKFSEFQLTNLNPAQIVLQADTPPSLADLQSMIPSDLITNIGRLGVEATADPKVFQVRFVSGQITAAADYLQWSDQFVPAFDDVRAALKRPYAMIPGDYSQPFLSPIPNFIMMRALAQTLAQRTQCYLLLGQPEKALQELTLLNDSRRILEGAPTGKPMTLVAAMINVAVTGLYADTIADGFQKQAWQDPQLAALQKQLEQINVPSFVAQAFESEPAATTRTLETIPPTKLVDLFSLHPNEWKWALWPLIKSALLPRGWIYQNMATEARLVFQQTEGFDPANDVISPKKFGDLTHELNAIAKPYKFIAAEAIPNFTKAWQTTAYNQTLVNEAQIVCALERYHLAHGEYPETLDALAPQFIEKIPHDIIGGQPLIYRLTDDGKFLLYSVGWNEKDDGGTPGTLQNPGQGDWVWK